MSNTDEEQTLANLKNDLIHAIKKIDDIRKSLNSHNNAYGNIIEIMRLNIALTYLCSIRQQIREICNEIRSKHFHATFESSHSLKQAVELFFSNEEEAIKIYGEIKYWDVSAVDTDMNYLFSNKNLQNIDLSMWDVSNVESMIGMFENAICGGGIRFWDVSGAKNMADMFKNASLCDENLNLWNVTNVESMACMFMSAKLGCSNISGWDVSNVKNMNLMFADASYFEQRIDFKISPNTSIENMKRRYV